MNDVVDELFVVHLNENGEPPAHEKHMVERVQQGINRMVRNLEKLKSCTVRIRVRLEYEVLS